MADTAVSVLMGNVARLLDQDKEYLLPRVELKVETLQKELVTINSFLKNSESKRTDNDEVEEVVDRIRDFSEKAEDVVDKYMAKIIELRGKPPLVRKLYRYSLFSRGKTLRVAAKNIKSVRNTTNLIYSNKDRYGIFQEGDEASSTTVSVTEAEAEAGPSTNVHVEKHIEESTDHGIRALSSENKGSTPSEKEDSRIHRQRRAVFNPVVGFDRKTEKLVLDAVPIIGMGGLGSKTTLPSKTYDHGIRALPSEHKVSTPSQQEEDSHSRSRRWFRADFNSPVVGFGHETEKLVSQLVKGDPRLDAVSITGMGGLGKTTLASKIYHHRHVRNHFQCKAWVFASQNYKTKDYLFGILRCLVSSVPEEMYRVSEQELKLTLRAFLREKRYLIVLDDLCTTRVWDEIRDAFPNSFNGSRLLITSNKPVALFATQTPPYSLSSLDEENSWRLFCKKVSPLIRFNPDLEAPGKQLVRRCKGVPLAILVLGGLLAHKEDKYETWSKLIDKVSYNYSQNTRSLDILALSYSQLPRNLKPCFLHLGVFPVDFEISARYLIKLWLAEGLIIQETETKTVEDIAEEYLEELAARSLIRVTERRTDGGAKACHIHDLLRQLSITVSLKEKFLEVHSESNPASIRKARRVSRVTNRRAGVGGLMASCTHDVLIREFPISKRIKQRFLEVDSEANSASASKARRLSIQGNISEYISSYTNIPSLLHSLLLFGEGEDFDKKRWRWIFKNFKFLRVLCLERLCLNSIPKHIEKLVFLRYLRIRSEKVVEIAAIPASMCNLQYLEEIDINGHVEECLPKEMWMMKRLRNVRFSGGMSIHATPTSEDNISIKLQVLSYVLVDENTKFLMSHIRFPYLRKLHLKYDHGLTQMNEFEVADVLESLCPKEKEKELGNLSPKGKEKELGSLKKLENLKILNFPTSEPRSNLFPSTLVKITFLRSYFDSTHFGILAKLPNLEILKLKGKFPYYGILGPLRCVAGDFPKLQVLQMVDLEIEIWALEKGAMEKLERLVISECYQLRNVPEELVKLSALRSVEVSRISKSLTKMLKKLNFKGKCKLFIDSKPLN